MQGGNNTTEKRITKKGTHFNMNCAENKIKISIQNLCALPTTQNWQNHPAILWFPCLFWNPTHTEALPWSKSVKTEGEQSSSPSSVYLPSCKASPLHNFPLFPFLPNSQEPMTTYELASILFHPALFRGLVKYMGLHGGTASLLGVLLSGPKCSELLLLKLWENS